MKKLNKFLGTMFGGAIGDALGEPVEFLTLFDWVSGYRDGKGERTDDTAMALLLADSLLRCGGTNIEDQLDNYLKWHQKGYMGLRPYPAGEGIQTARSLNAYEEYKEGSRIDKHREIDLSGRHLDGNGALMRIGPVPLFFYDDPREALKGAEDSCISTHNTIICKHACMFYTGLIWGALHGVNKKDLLQPFYSPVEGYREKIGGLVPEVAGVVEGSYQFLEKEELEPSGYIVDSMEAALWAFYHFDNFKDGVEAAVNLGGDTDTIGCIYGYLGGAYYGYDSFPKEWIDELMDSDRIKEYAERLCNYKKSL